MSRILILLMFVFWLAWKPDYSRSPLMGLNASLGVFFGFYFLLVAGTGLWSRRLRHKVAGARFGKSLDRFNLVMLGARIAVPVWFMAGIAVLGWYQAVEHLLGSGKHLDLTQTAVGVLVGTAPAFAAWMALW